MGVKAKSTIRYFIGKSFMRDGLLRVSVYPVTAQSITAVNRAMKDAGYQPVDRETYLRLRKDAARQVGRAI